MKEETQSIDSLVPRRILCHSDRILGVVTPTDDNDKRNMGWFRLLSGQT